MEVLMSKELRKALASEKSRRAISAFIANRGPGVIVVDGKRYKIRIGGA
jgi:hypothetical protein